MSTVWSDEPGFPGRLGDKWAGVGEQEPYIIPPQIIGSTQAFIRFNKGGMDEWEYYTALRDSHSKFEELIDHYGKCIHWANSIEDPIFKAHAIRVFEEFPHLLSASTLTVRLFKRIVLGEISVLTTRFKQKAHQKSLGERIEKTERRMGSTPPSRTLQKRAIVAARSVYEDKTTIQCRVQARSG
ncbi:MAG: hypothetical protein AAGA11_12080 [Pseudomonadota bacterium]